MRKTASHCAEQLKYAAACRALMSAVVGIDFGIISAIRISPGLMAEYCSSCPRMTKRMRDYFADLYWQPLADRCPE
jgi:hypothetical protein